MSADFKNPAGFYRAVAGLPTDQPRCCGRYPPDAVAGLPTVPQSITGYPPSAISHLPFSDSWWFFQQAPDSAYEVPPEGTIDHDLRWGAYPSHSRLCADWLLAFLTGAGAPVKPRDVVEAARQASFPCRTLYRTRRALAGRIVDVGGRPRDPGKRWAIIDWPERSQVFAGTRQGLVGQRTD